MQEALTNVHRHSGSEKVDISLRVAEMTVWLEVKDYGCGISEDRLARVRDENAQVGVGLAGMRERVHQLGGSMDLSSNAEGTHIVVTIPIGKDGMAKEKTKNSSRFISAV